MNKYNTLHKTIFGGDYTTFASWQKAYSNPTNYIRFDHNGEMILIKETNYVCNKPNFKTLLVNDLSHLPQMRDILDNTNLDIVINGHSTQTAIDSVEFMEIYNKKHTT